MMSYEIVRKICLNDVDWMDAGLNANVDFIFGSCGPMEHKVDLSLAGHKKVRGQFLVASMS